MLKPSHQICDLTLKSGAHSYLGRFSIHPTDGMALKVRLPRLPNYSPQICVVLRMDFSAVIGQKHLQSHLLKAIENRRVPHAQLFVGKTGSGLLPAAIAFARELLCSRYADGTREHEICAHKVEKLAHPDLHFVYPVTTNNTVKKNPISSLFIEDWRHFVATNPYGSLFDWLRQLGSENKQGTIAVREAEEMSKTLSLKAFEGGYKIMILWMAEKMNNECANKILKLLEEPPHQTVFLLLCEEESRILTTIRSRCQALHFPLLSESSIAAALVSNRRVTETVARRIAQQAQGDYSKALHILGQDGEEAIFEKWLVRWLRAAFQAKKTKKAVQLLLEWSEEMAKQGREAQKKFLEYCLEVFRQALLKNYQVDSLVFIETQHPTFSIEKFAPFIHPANIFDITAALEDAYYHIERNGNAKIVFSDLSMQLTRLIHKKETV